MNTLSGVSWHVVWKMFADLLGEHYSKGNGEFTPGVKWQGHKADSSPPYSAEVKNFGAIPPLPHMLSWHSR
jgi:hypothetical protein